MVKLHSELRIYHLLNTICKTTIHIRICMNEFPLRTAEQLGAMLQSFRRQAGMTQADVAVRLGITQQTLSALERNAQKVSADRLLALLSILGVELVMRHSDNLTALKPPSDQDW
jgi:HTH-type transcriptional regulator/antitoxin HipB